MIAGGKRKRGRGKEKKKLAVFTHRDVSTVDHELLSIPIPACSVPPHETFFLFLNLFHLLLHKQHQLTDIVG